MIKTILGIETSCDETGAAIGIKQGSRVKILSNIVASSASLQAKYGGVIPEQAAREQLKSIIPVIQEALEQAHLTPARLDAVGVTFGPGLIGSLLVGVETAKTLALLWHKPLIPVNHLIGHFYANWIETNTSNSITPAFPCLGLLVSGGHTDLVLFKNHGQYQYIGGTRDDAAGEAFDKTARLLGLPYPGGPQISKLAQKGDPTAFHFPRPMIDSDDFDFSFSGLKTAVATTLQGLAKSRPAKKCGAVKRTTNLMILHKVLRETNLKRASLYSASGFLRPDELANLSASIEQAIVDVLVRKTVAAAQYYRIEQIIVAGGVASNQNLRKQLTATAKESLPRVRIFIPHPSFCTDNAAMITSAAFFGKEVDSPLAIQAYPNLTL